MFDGYPDDGTTLPSIIRYFTHGGRDGKFYKKCFYKNMIVNINPVTGIYSMKLLNVHVVRQEMKIKLRSFKGSEHILLKIILGPEIRFCECQIIHFIL